MNTQKIKMIRTLFMVFAASLIFSTCNEEDEFDNESFNANDLRVLKVSTNGETLSSGDIGIQAFDLELEVVFSTAVNQSDVLGALSLSNDASYTASFDETESILMLTVETLDYETDYTVSLPAGTYGENGEELSSDYILNFTTAPFFIPTVSLSSSSTSIAEDGGIVSITATLEDPTSEDVIVSLAYSGSATIDEDYTASTEITIPAGDGSASIDATGVDDLDVEGEESFTVAISDVVNGSEDGDQSLEISVIDDDVFTDLEIKGVMALRWTTETDGNSGKAVHLRATADIPDLSVYGVGVANNGGGTDGIEYQLPVMSASAGDDILIAREQSALASYFGSLAEFEIVLDANTSISQNGNDAIELFSGPVVIETYGDADVDGTGLAWEYSGSWGYKLGDSYIYGGIDCTSSSGPNTTQESDCTYPLYLNALQIQGVMSFEIESRDRAIHLRANRDIADLSVYGIGIPNNGGLTDGREMDLASISVSEGDHILFMRGEDEETITSYLGACFNDFDHTFTDTGSDINFNGDDPFELYENTTVIEYYGSIDGGTGEYEDGTGLFWEYQGSWAYKQYGDTYIYGGVDCTTAGTTNATSACPYAFCE